MTAIPPPDARNLQRLRYWQGQMLRSRDFRDQLAIEGQLRCWHNRAMHNAFGVASGFKVLGASLFTSLFSEGDFIHLDAFVAKLRTQDPTQDPVSKFLWSEFSALTKEVLKSATSTPEQQKSALVKALDNILKGTSIYDETRFAKVILSQETIALKSQNPTGKDSIRLNRLLLEDAYPLEIAKRLKMKGEESVKIQPGIAYDEFGHEILLQHEHSLGVPQSNELLTLLARYKGCGSYPRKAEVGTPFFAARKHLFAEEPEFAWKLSASIKLRDGVPLAGVQDGELTPDEKFTKPVARPIARPRVASDQTILGATRWETWTIAAAESRGAYGFQVMIDASAVGFTETPCYFAWLQGPIWDEDDQHTAGMSDRPAAGGGSGVDTGTGPQEVSNVGGVHWDHIEGVSRKGFVFRFVMIPFANLENLLRNSPQVVRPKSPQVVRPKVMSLLRKRYFVSWIGIQPDAELDAKSNVAR